ncbi:fucolectin-6-like [Hydractinia symbiolongicarpus]|uniref:fucolectin-6-like n=1 Tax=Hydractinia symbiolongicarpus TaxID=13093 RepID=UPI00254B93BD|nr:fucolectin-6-like [Hydractinia symbiolongicarpus]
MTNINIWPIFLVAISMANWCKCTHYVKTLKNTKYQIITEIFSCGSLLTCVQKCSFRKLDAVYEDGKCYCVVTTGNKDGDESENKKEATEVYLALKDPLNYSDNEHEPASINLSRGKPARQSSVHRGSFSPDASLGVDGNTNGIYETGSCFHTAGNESNAWWEVELLQNAVITNVVLYPRTHDCCHFRANNLKLLVRSANQDSWNLCAFIEQLGATPFDQKCGQPVVGSIFRIVQQNTEPLHLCEVEVFGYFL